CKSSAFPIPPKSIFQQQLAKDSKRQHIPSLAFFNVLDMHILLLYTFPFSTIKLPLYLTSKQQKGENMEAKLLPQSRSPIATALRRKHKQGCSPILAVLASPAENIAGITEKLTLKPAESKSEVVQKTSVRCDNWFELMAISHLSQSLQAATGLKIRKSGYESLVEAAAMMSKKFNPSRQQELVIQALNSAIPRIILNMASILQKEGVGKMASLETNAWMELTRAPIPNNDGNVKTNILVQPCSKNIKTLLPQSQFTREYFAAFTTVFFAWLIGPSEVRASELNGRREKNVVHVRKCRFLEQSNCVGMCINLCKMPSQAFIKDSLGMPVNMVPNFDDMSCEMIFGQDPPASNDDPALKQPCYKLCRANQKHAVKCSS
ncbi:Beta-carotene isomerase D27-like, partial [Theobroma cacao]